MTEFGRDPAEARRLKGATCLDIKFVPDDGGSCWIKLALPDGATVEGRLSPEEYDEWVFCRLPILIEATVSEP